MSVREIVLLEAFVGLAVFACANYAFTNDQVIESEPQKLHVDAASVATKQEEPLPPVITTLPMVEELSVNPPPPRKLCAREIAVRSAKQRIAANRIASGFAQLEEWLEVVRNFGAKPSPEAVVQQ